MFKRTRDRRFSVSMIFYDYNYATHEHTVAARSSVQVVAADWNDAVKLAYRYSPNVRYSDAKVTEVRALGHVTL